MEIMNEFIKNLYKKAEPITNFSLPNTKNFKHYTVGFYFCDNIVLLIRKAKPEWQAGRLNGIGGSFEPEDENDCIKCMQREFAEETGNPYSIIRSNIIKNWSKFAEGEVCCHQGDCFIHYMVAEGYQGFPLNMSNNEECIWIPLYKKLPVDCVPNLHWLIPMARLAIDKPWWSEIATFRTLI